MMTHTLIIILLLLGISFAWVDATPTCLTTYNILGVNMTTEQKGAAIPCATSSTRLSNINQTGGTWNNGAAGGSGCTVIPTEGGISIVSGKLRIGVAVNTRTSYGLSATGTASIQLPSSGNYTFTYDAGSGSSTIAGITLTTGTAGTINEHNATHFNITANSGGSTVYAARSEVITISLNLYTQCGGTCGTCTHYVEFDQAFNYTTGYTGSITKLSTQQNQDYFSIYGNHLNRGDFKNGMSNGNESYCKVLIYSGSTLLIPKITYEPSTDAFGYFYNSTSSVSYIKNNTATYFVDTASGLWYLVLPFTCVDFATIYAQAAYAYPYSSSTVSVPSMYLVQNCYASSTNYSWDIKGTSSHTYIMTKNWVNSSGMPVITTDTFTGVEYNSTINITNASTITITDAGYTVCAWQNGTSLFFTAPSFISSDALTALIGKFMVVVMTGVSVVVPFAAVGILFFNDIFAVFTQAQAFYLASFAVAFSFLINSYSERTLKNLGFYFTIGMACFAYFTATQVGGFAENLSDKSCIPTLITNPTQGAGVAIQTSLSDMMTAITTANVGGFITSAPAFLLSLVTFAINLVGYVYAGIFLPLKCINLNLYNAASALGTTITLGLALYILVKAYEVLSNKYQRV